MISTHQSAIRCPFCRDEMSIKQGGSAFVYSQIVNHLRPCPARPQDDVHATVWVLASTLTTDLLSDKRR
jgi:hypothetical protein